MDGGMFLTKIEKERIATLCIDGAEEMEKINQQGGVLLSLNAAAALLRNLKYISAYMSQKLSYTKHKSQGRRLRSWPAWRCSLRAVVLVGHGGEG